MTNLLLSRNKVAKEYAEKDETSLKKPKVIVNYEEYDISCMALRGVIHSLKV